MGYIARNVTAEAVKRTVSTTIPLCILNSYFGGATYVTVYKNTMDVTDLDTLVLSLNNHGASQATIKISFDTTTIDESAYASATRHFATFDVSAYTGDYVVKLEIKFAAADKALSELSFYGMES